MSLARKMKRKDERPANKEQKRQQVLAAKSERLANELNRQIERDRYNVEVQAFYKMAIITNWVLHNEFGFGGKGDSSRLLRFQDKMAHLCSCIHDPKCGITIDGLHEELKKETGFDTIWHLNKRRYNEKAEVCQ